MRHAVEHARLDVQENGIQAAVKAYKGEAESRKIVFTISDGGNPFPLETVSSAVLRLRKPGGGYLYNSCTLDGDRVIYTMTSQTLAETGTVMAQLELNGVNAQRLYAPKFKILVEENLYSDTALESTDEFTELQEALAAAGNMINSAEVTAAGDLWFYRANGMNALNAGHVKGDQGDKGDKGDTGAQGNPGEDAYNADWNVDFLGVPTDENGVLQSDTLFDVWMTLQKGDALITNVTCGIEASQVAGYQTPDAFESPLEEGMSGHWHIAFWKNGKIHPYCYVAFTVTDNATGYQATHRISITPVKQGATGAKGDTGTQGPQGNPGIQGPKGDSPTFEIDDNGHLIAIYP